VFYVTGPVAGLQSPDLTSSARISQPASRSSPQHSQSHAQSVRVPASMLQHSVDADSGLTNFTDFMPLARCHCIM